jgi:hypothetical protein
MRFSPRPVDATLHGFTDYTVGSMLVTVFPKLAGLEKTESARQTRLIGAAHLGYSTLTDYPLGIVKLIPFKVHLAVDAIGAVAVGALPFITGQWRKGPKHWVPHIGLCVMELSALALTDPTGMGDFHGDVEAVRANNMENPQRKIYEGEPSVRPAVVRAAA